MKKKVIKIQKKTANTSKVRKGSTPTPRDNGATLKIKIKKK